MYYLFPAPARDENHNEICSEHLLEREEWPWLGEWLTEYYEWYLELLIQAGAGCETLEGWGNLPGFKQH